MSTKALSTIVRLLVAGSIALSTSPFAAEGKGTPGDPQFVDATSGSGIDFVNVCGKAGNKGWITEHMGAGAAWLDFDGDGHLDLYLVNGSDHTRAAGRGEPNRLFRGDGRGKFTDLTAKSGSGHRGWGYGVAVGDVDNDGDPDIYVTNLGPNVLYLNRGDGTFEDATARAGVGDASWGTSAAFFDMENDGDLDLFVGNYVTFDPARVPRRGSKQATPTSCVFRGIPVFCGPRGLIPAPNVLYRNNGDGTFRDVSATSGIHPGQHRFTLGVVSGDYDNDGDQDLYAANDSVANSMFRNRGDGTFEDVALTSLSALDASGNPQGCMGTNLGDYNGDGWLDLVVTNFSHDLNTVYRNVSGKFFIDESTSVGMPVTTLELSWGTGFHDFDSDGDLNLFIANGHVYPEVENRGIGSTYKQSNHVFTNDDGFFRLAHSPGTRIAESFRGAAFGDYDEDGDVDVVVTAVDAPALLLRNDTAAGGHYLGVLLVGSGSNRDAVGARVTLTAGGKRQIRERLGGGSYLSASEPRLHFGLGDAERIEKLEVRWPSGKIQRLADIPADQLLVIREEGP